jgi:hypothetical protein
MVLFIVGLTAGLNRGFISCTNTQSCCFHYFSRAGHPDVVMVGVAPTLLQYSLSSNTSRLQHRQSSLSRIRDDETVTCEMFGRYLRSMLCDTVVTKILILLIKKYYFPFVRLL